MKHPARFIQVALATVLCLSAAAPRVVQGSDLPARKTRTVVLIVSDGLCWQEIFDGAEADLLNDEMTTGYPNDAIGSNEFGPNPNPTGSENIGWPSWDPTPRRSGNACVPG
jgi:hypothetical protein